MGLQWVFWLLFPGAEMYVLPLSLLSGELGWLSFPAAQRLLGAHQWCCLKGRLSRSQPMVNGGNHSGVGHASCCPTGTKNSLWPYRHTTHGCRCRHKSSEVWSVTEPSSLWSVDANKFLNSNCFLSKGLWNRSLQRYGPFQPSHTKSAQRGLIF